MNNNPPMKILVLQIATLSYVYLTWPAIRALKRKYPKAEIHLLVQEEYQYAVDEIQIVNKIHAIKKSLSSLAIDYLHSDMFGSDKVINSSLEQILTQVKNFANTLKNENYDIIYNLSFSPFSSYFTYLIQNNDQKVKGYNRHSDGYLNIIDDVSAYFYAQTGHGRPNRIHLTSLFGAIMDVELTIADWDVPPEFLQLHHLNDINSNLEKHPYIVLHIDSEATVTKWSVDNWTNLISLLIQEWPGQIVLVGNFEDQLIVKNSAFIYGHEKVLNLINKITSNNLFAILQKAKILVSCDSVSIHIASFSGTQSINLNFNSSNFWEIGPRASGSLVLWTKKSDDLKSDLVFKQIMHCVEGEEPLAPYIKVKEGIAGYEFIGYPIDSSDEQENQNFEWQLVQAIYMNGKLPKSNSKLFLQSLIHFEEINEIAFSQLDALKKNSKNIAPKEILNRVDEIIHFLFKTCPEIRPLIEWYFTQKIRIKPSSLEEILKQTYTVHQQLQIFFDCYNDFIANRELCNEV